MHRVFKKEQILTIPNLLSTVRLLLIPVILWLYCKKQNYGGATLVMILSGITDVADGIIARKFHMVSNFGKILDPVADKLTQIAVLCVLNPQFWWVVAALILKELVIGILSLTAIAKTHRVYSAGWYGKLCTVVIYLSMFVLILWRDAPETFVLVDSLVIVALIALSFVKYFVYYRKIIMEARREQPREAS